MTDGTRLLQIAEAKIDQVATDVINTAAGTSLSVAEARVVFVAMISLNGVMPALTTANAYLARMQATLTNLEAQRIEAQQRGAPKSEYDALVAAYAAIGTAMQTAYSSGDDTAPSLE